tara:strand:+ start:1036 stop:1545 length:510 start_codon:yes stop_codon:yes gene_type:complete
MDNTKQYTHINKSYKEFDNIESQKNFSKDIDIGESGEGFIKEFLINKGYNFISDNKDYRYDLLMSYGEANFTYEIKTDVYISPKKDTGNLVVEFESRGKPSGISVTEADFYVYFMPKMKEIWNIKMDKLKDLIKSNNFKEVSGGDKGSDTKMYLIKRSTYKEYFKVHNI